MKVVCKYCGKIHEKNFDCGKKPVRGFKKKTTDKDKFRWTNEWKRKREYIKERDKYLCRYCLSIGKINYIGLSVHHIIPLEDDFSKRIEDSNLITLCDKHHEDAEKGLIARNNLQMLANTPPGV